MTPPPADVTRLDNAKRRSPVPIASVQGTLALELAPLLDAPAVPELRLLPGGAADDGVPPLVRKFVQQWSARFAQAAVEVVLGDRPVTQLVRWTTPRVYAELTRRAQIVAQAGVHQAGHGHGRQPVIRPQVASVRVCHPSPECAEVSVHVRYGQRSRALAARLDVIDDRWQCTAIQFG